MNPSTNPIAGAGKRFGNLWSGIKSAASSAYNGAADAGGWIKSVFSNPGSHFQPPVSSNAPPGVYSTPSGVVGATDAPMFPNKTNAPTSSFGIPTANAQTTGAGTGASPQAPAAPADGVYSAGQALPAVGSPEYMQAQANAQTSLAPKNFSINPGENISSSSMNPTTTTQDALNYANSQRQSLFNGSAPAGTVPSDSLYGSVINGIFNASQYTPEEQAALGQYNDTQSRILSTQLAARRQLQQLQEDGQITKEQAAGFLTEAQRRSDAQLADLATQQSGNTLSLQTLGMLRQNQLGAYQNIASFLKPEQVSPGNSLVNPLTGQQTYQGTGASPQTIAQQANTFISQDEATGNLQLNKDGTINQAYYQNKAQSYYQNGLGQSQGGMQMGTPSGQAGQSTSQGGGVSSLPPNIANQPYVIPASNNAPAYINLGRVPSGQQQYVATTAGRAGVPVLSADDASNVQGIQYTQQALQPLETVMNKVLAPGIIGRGMNVAKNFINNIFQNQPELVAFNQARSTAIKVIQSLAAGSGSGFRLTQPEIDTATNNMPLATDNLETAQTKLSYVKSYLANELNLKITGNSNNYTAPGASGSTGQTIQTKVGAVDNSWFK